MNKINILFMGTPDFSVPCLKMLCSRDDVTICGVVTQPDKQKGRGYKLLPPPVKEFALSNGLDVYQPDTLKGEEFQKYLYEKQPDLIIVIAYGKILPKNVIDFPKYGCINVHASLLPKYRGAAPIQWCIINGEKTTGVTTMLMDEGLDTGDMLVKKEVQIDEMETAGSLFDKLADVGVLALSETIDLLKENNLVPIKQDHSKMTYASMISKEFSYIDWTKTDDEICQLIRGLNPFPGAKTLVKGKILKIYMATPDGFCDKSPGTVINSKDKLVVACGENTSISILEVQPEGKKILKVEQFLQGNIIEEGIILG